MDSHPHDGTVSRRPAPWSLHVGPPWAQWTPVPPQPHLVATGAGALSPKTVRLAMLSYGALATPKKPEEEHKIHPGWRPRARLGRQFPSDSPKKGPVLAPTCPAAPDSPEARAR